MRFLFRSLTLVALFTAFLVEVAVVYFVQNPMMRSVVGMLLILPILWIVSRTDMTEIMTEMYDGDKKRHFKGLRSRVVQLLDEIRRLNWLAVDAERGFRSRDEALREMDLIESHLKEIISDIRRAAGQSSGEIEHDPRAAAEDPTAEFSAPMEASILPADEEESNPEG